MAPLFAIGGQAGLLYSFAKPSGLARELLELLLLKVDADQLHVPHCPFRRQTGWRGEDGDQPQFNLGRIASFHGSSELGLPQLVVSEPDPEFRLCRFCGGLGSGDFGCEPVDLLGFDSDCTVIIWESIRPSRDIARIASMADSVHSGEFSLKEIAENESESIDERVWFGTVDNAEAWLDQNGSPEERFVAVVFNEDALEDLIT